MAEDTEDEDASLEWRNDRTLKIDKQSVASIVKIAEMMMKHIGPYLLWIVAAIAWGIFIVSTFYAWSLVR